MSFFGLDRTGTSNALTAEYRSSRLHRLVWRLGEWLESLGLRLQSWQPSSRHVTNRGRPLSIDEINKMLTTHYPLTKDFYAPRGIEFWLPKKDLTACVVKDPNDMPKDPK